MVMAITYERKKQKRAYKLARLRIKEENDNQIIHFN